MDQPFTSALQIDYTNLLKQRKSFNPMAIGLDTQQLPYSDYEDYFYREIFSR